MENQDNKSLQVKMFKPPFEDFEVADVIASVCSFGIYPMLVAIKRVFGADAAEK